MTLRELAERIMRTDRRRDHRALAEAILNNEVEPLNPGAALDLQAALVQPREDLWDDDER